MNYRYKEGGNERDVMCKIGHIILYKEAITFLFQIKMIQNF